MNTEMNKRAHTMVVKRIIPETKQAMSFVLGFKNDSLQKLNYKAGQFLTFIFYNAGGQEVRRNYSISSSPVLDEDLTITVKRIPNGEFSRKLVDSTGVGDELLILGAAGFFTLPENIAQYRQLFFIVAGSGITPAYSLIKTALHLYPKISVVLIYSNSSESTTIFHKDLLTLESQYPGRFTIEFLFSNASNLLRARLNTSLLNDLLEQNRSTSLENMLFYICGPLDYMRMITIYLNIKKVAPAQVRKEIFVIEKPLRHPQPPDKDPHLVTFITKNGRYEVVSRYPSTILQTAKSNGIPLPYSCESGQCGTCVARCISGKVWMYNNEVLTDDELGKGIVLTCTGYPIGGDLTLLI